MNKNDIENYILKNFDDIHPLERWGEKSFFLNPGRQFTHGTYFATLKETDSKNDAVSFLNREGIFRLNMGVTKDCYLSLFSYLPKQPKKGNCIEGNYDFQEVDVLLPHPVYAWGAWICVLNPSLQTFEKCKTLLDNAYSKAQQTTRKKLAKLK